MLQDAEKKGLIKIANVTLRIDKIDIMIPGSIRVINGPGWELFLQDIIGKSDNDEEKYFVQQFLTIYEQITAQQQAQPTEFSEQKIMPKKLVHIDASQKVITHDDVTNLSIDLASCDSIEDVLKFMGVNTSTEIPKQINWKKPVIIDGTLRYIAHNTNWYIDRQAHGRDFYYSIFNAEKREVARYDRIKDAKDDILNIIKKLS